jgi:hypothetical protein
MAIHASRSADRIRHHDDVPDVASKSSARAASALLVAATDLDMGAPDRIGL